MKRIFFIALFSVLVVGIKAQSFNLIVQKTDATEETWTPDNLANIYFEADTMLILVESTTATTHSYPLAEIQKLYFVSTMSLADFSINNGKMFVYPNPSQDYIRIIGAGSNESFKIYAIDGRLVAQGDVADEMIDVSHLAQGLYVVKIGTKTLKFSKL